MKFGEIKGVTFLSRNSGGANFLTNLMSGGGVQFKWNIPWVVQVFHKRGYVPFIVKCFFFRSTDKETSEGALLRHVSAHKPNNIRIRIRVIFSNRIIFVFVFGWIFFIFVFVFGWFFRPNNIWIRLIFWDQILLILKWFF